MSKALKELNSKQENLTKELNLTLDDKREKIKELAYEVASLLVKDYDRNSFLHAYDQAVTELYYPHQAKEKQS